MDTSEGKVWKIIYEHYIKEIASKFVIERGLGDGDVSEEDNTHTDMPESYVEM